MTNPTHQIKNFENVDSSKLLVEHIGVNISNLTNTNTNRNTSPNPSNPYSRERHRVLEDTPVDSAKNPFLKKSYGKRNPYLANSNSQLEFEPENSIQDLHNARVNLNLNGTSASDQEDRQSLVKNMIQNRLLQQHKNNPDKSSVDTNRNKY
jgi:hypothetical protein